MAILLKGIMTAKQILRRSNLLANQATEVPKGFFAVYVGESQKKRFTVPISFLNQPSFQELLRIAEEEFGYNHPMGGLTLPCREDTFIDIISGLNLS
ncbi:auxin-responsive protein SAUR21-like [Populus alba]|nr:auxin-responsive protein SAUR21-like [Populus alba]